MAKSNRDRMGDVMDALKEGLGPFVLREYLNIYKSEFVREIDAVLTTSTYELPREAWQDVPSLLAVLDIHSLLRLIWQKWNEVFKEKLGQSERNYVSDLMTARNDWAHQKAFDNDNAHRCADTATRLVTVRRRSQGPALYPRGIAQ